MVQTEYKQGVHLIREDVVTEKLVIGPDAELTAPEGKYLTLTVNGCGRPLLPGSYLGDVRITVSELKYEEEYPSMPRRGKRIPMKAALVVEDGQVVPQKGVLSVIQGGTVTGRSANDIFISSSEENFAGRLLSA